VEQPAVPAAPVEQPTEKLEIGVPADRVALAVPPTPTPAPEKLPARPATRRPPVAKPEKEVVVPVVPKIPVDPEQTVRNTLRLSITAFEQCYEASLRRDNRVKGRIVVTVNVLASGKIASAKMVETTVRDETVTACILTRLRQVRFPELGEDLELTLPLELVLRSL
jgi:hypothetical protein